MVGNMLNVLIMIRSKRPLSIIFPPYILSSGTNERIEKLRHPPFKSIFEKYPPFNCILDKYQMQLGEVVSVQAVSLVAQN